MTVKFTVQISDDAGAPVLDPDRVYVELCHIAFLDGAGDDGSVVADEADVVEYQTVGVVEVETR